MKDDSVVTVELGLCPEYAYQNKGTEFNNKQAAFVQDILTCYQLINVIENLEKGVPVASQP